MVTVPKTMAPDITVRQARGAFADLHVHMLLLVENGQLLGTLRRDDLEGHPADAPAQQAAILEGRTTEADHLLDGVYRRMVGTGERRLAVIGDRRRLVGLLCLKSDRSGFCSDEGIRSRAAGRANSE